jgi:TolA-binding protein
MMDAVDKEVSEKLFNLYHASLFDEDFQQAIIADIKQLSDEKIALLNEDTRSFVKDEKLPAKLMKTLHVPPRKHFLDRLQLLAKKIRSFSISSPAITVPISLVFGILLGVNFLSFTTNSEMTTPSIPMEENTPTTRGSDAPEITLTDATQINSTQNETDEALEQIASLILDGNIEEAEQQIKKFKQDYPDFKPSIGLE